MADRALVLFLALELEYDRFVAAAVSGNRCRYSRAAESAAGDQLARVVHNSKNALELDFGSHVAGDGFNLNRVARSDAELFSAGLNHCVHNLAILLELRNWPLWNRSWGRNLYVTALCGWLQRGYRT